MTTRGRRWSSTEQTRRSVLAAAGDVFRRRGYAATSMADIAGAAEVSIGSLYHHFTGKYELFVAVWREYDNANQRTAASAVAAACAGGASEPGILFVAGLRAYLLAGWTDPELARLFADGDTPSGFARTRRQADQAWVQENLRLLIAERPGDRMRLALLTGMLEPARREIAVTSTVAQADELLDAALELMRDVVDLVSDRHTAGPPARLSVVDGALVG